MAGAAGRAGGKVLPGDRFVIRDANDTLGGGTSWRSTRRATAATTPTTLRWRR